MLATWHKNLPKNYFYKYTLTKSFWNYHDQFSVTKVLYITNAKSMLFIPTVKAHTNTNTRGTIRRDINKTLSTATGIYN